MAPAAALGEARFASIRSAQLSPMTALKGWNRTMSIPCKEEEEWGAVGGEDESLNFFFFCFFSLHILLFFFIFFLLEDMRERRRPTPTPSRSSDARGMYAGESMCVC